MLNEPTLIHFKEQSVSTPNKNFAKKLFEKFSRGNKADLRTLRPGRLADTLSAQKQ